MSLIVFILLAALTAVAIAYPLLKPGTVAPSEAGVSDAQIDRAVQRLRQARKRRAGPACPACGAPYQPGDAFCVRCGQALPRQEAAPTPAPERVCPSCGAALRPDDRFCARCGHRLSAPAGESGLEEVQS